MKKHFDYFLFSVVCFLMGFSVIFFFTLSTTASLQRSDNLYYYFLHQFLSGYLPALILGFLAYKIPLDYIKKISPILLVINLFFIFLIFSPLGVTAGGATRWINLGFFNFQPSEFLKIISILYLSSWIASKLSYEKIKGWKDRVKKGYHNVIYILAPFIIFLSLISIGLYYQRDAGTLGIIALTLLAIYCYAKTPLWHNLVILSLGLSFLLYMVKFEPYRLDRWLIFLNPNHDPLGKGFQLKQSIISLGSGGFWGKGLGMSVQKFGYLPQATSDSIFAVMGEEIGFIGLTVVIIAFVLFFFAGLKISRNSHDTFSKLAAFGIVFWISIQALINMASATGIFPLTGIPLPFFSYGGSHIVVELIGVGILLNISKS